MPPPVFDTFKTNVDALPVQSLGVIVETVRGAVNFKAGKRDVRIHQPSAPEEDEDDVDKDIFTTDMTYDLMTQLKEVLGMLPLYSFVWKLSIRPRF